MSRVNFKDLISATFENEAVNTSYLKLLFESLATKLELEDDQVLIENLNLRPETSETYKVDNAQMMNLKLKPENLLKDLCKNDTNSIVEMFDLLNVAKRIEALEFSFQKMTSVMEAVLENQSNIDQKIRNIKKLLDESSQDVKPSTVSGQFKPIEQTPKTSFGTLVQDTLNREKQELVQIPTEVKSNTQEIEEIVQRKVEFSMLHYEELLETVKHNVCELQKRIETIQEQIDDLMFACEQNDLKSDDTASEIKDFASNVFCLKSDVKGLLRDSLKCKDKSYEMETKYETLNNMKTNKSYVDELWSQKAFKSDLEFYVRREEFEPVSDVIRLKLSLLEEHFGKLKISVKKILASFKSEIDDKLNSSELVKFKSIISKSFQAFLSELKLLICELMKSQVGIGATNKLTPRNLTVFRANHQLL